MSRPKRTRSSDDQRLMQRFPIEQDVSYKCVRGKKISAAGCGRTVSMSSGELTITTEQELAPKQRVEVAVNWPAMLDSICPMKLVIGGHVLRTDGCNASVSIEHYEFRTRGVNRTGAQASTQAATA